MHLVVGAGLTGATIARCLADIGENVLVIDRRSHIGGNCADYTDESGIRLNMYGPHYFRTNSDHVWSFVNRFTEFYGYEAKVVSRQDDGYFSWPVTANYMASHIAPDWQPAFKGKPTNFEEASLAMMPRQIYEDFVKGYTEKQWGVPADSLSPDLAGRFTVREDNDTRLKKHKYQGLPRWGYTAMFRFMLEDIPVALNMPYDPMYFVMEKVWYTGPIDEFFDYRYGKLQYRGQRRSHKYYPYESYVFPCGQVNNPHDWAVAIREVEWKHMMEEYYARRIDGSLVTIEVPFTPDDPQHYEYPFPDQKNQDLYKIYRDIGRRMDNFVFCGRLGSYQYLDMDQAIQHAFDTLEANF